MLESMVLVPSSGHDIPFHPCARCTPLMSVLSFHLLRFGTKWDDLEIVCWLALYDSSAVGIWQQY